MTTELIKWDEINTQIATAKDFNIVKDMKDKLKGYETIAKQKNMSKDVQSKIGVYILRANRRMGEMLKEMPKAKGTKGQLKGKDSSGSTNVVVPEKTPTMKDLGLTWNESSLFQKMADVPEEKFEEMVEEMQEETDVVTEAVYKNTVKKIDREIQIKDQREGIENGTLNLPSGKYEIIVIDPPWKYNDDKVYDADGFRGVTDYPTMTIKEIGNIKLPHTDDCVLWLWTTHRFMRHAFTLLDSWGFEEKAILTWCKNKMGIGRWLRSKSEFCIMAVKGKPLIQLTNQTTVLNADMGKHSEKPQEFYDMVDQLCIGRKLDYFARKKRKGWDVFGDEV